MIVVTLLAALLGAALQRVSGMGFALVAAPFLVLLLGPYDGVMVVNIAGGALAVAVTVQRWRDIDWSRLALLGIPAFAAVIAGALFVVSTEGPVLQVVVAVLLILALTASLVAHRRGHRAPVVPSGLLAGAASGFLGVTAGTGGPPTSIFAVLTDWDQRRYSATLQPIFVTTSVTSIVAKTLLGDGRLPEIDPMLWIALLGALILGAVLGDILMRWVPLTLARRLVIVVAYAGSVAALLSGIADLTGS